MCGKLGLYKVEGKGKARSLEYSIDHGKKEQKLLLEWIERCDLCKLIYDLDQHWSENGDNTMDMKNVGYNYRYACGQNHCAALGPSILADWGESRSTILRCPCLMPPSCIDSILIERMVNIAVHPDPLSMSSIARMKHWVARCDSSDAKCKVQETALPTRVLDVRDSQNIKLCETGRRSGAYTALSHCWGAPNKTFLTTHETIADMKAGFSIEQAPATFRDAILVTRCLGMRYLWIDCLCIIQNDTADWSWEAARMGSLYANAYLTIAAANAKDDNDGFLQLRSYVLTSLSIISSTGNSAQVYLQTSYDLNKLELYNGKEPLDTRGWTLQEQRLSRRSLRFGSREISWDCQCFGLRESRTDHDNSMRTSMDLLNPRSTASMPLSYDSWYDMIFSFTRRLLKYDTDKFLALSGLATEVAKFQNGTYHAGLWWEDMARGMLWSKSVAVELNKPSEYLAPSWSWASLNGGTLRYSYFFPKFTLPDVVFRECHLEYKNDNAHGAIRSGWLDLSAPVVKLVLRENQYRESFDPADLDMALEFVNLGIPDIAMNGREDEDEDEDEGWYSRDSTKGSFVTRGVFDLAHKDRTEILGLLLMYSHRKAVFDEYGRDRGWISSQDAQEDSFHWFWLYGILVEYSKKRLAYKRVGYFEAMRLEPGEAIQILEGAEMQDIRLY